MCTRRGGGGSNRAKGGGDFVFTPTSTDAISTKLSTADHLTFSRNTITMKNTDDKTIGMVRGINRLSNMTGRQEWDTQQELRKAGVRLSELRAVGITSQNVYINGKQIYIFNNTRTAKLLSGMTKSQIAKSIMADDAKKIKARNELLQTAENNGVIIINH